MSNIFSANSTKHAGIVLTVPAGFSSYQIELYLSKDGGTTKAASSGLLGFTPTPGQSQVVLVPITMPAPTVTTSYTVFIAIYADGALIGSFVGATDADKVIIPVVIFGGVSWS